MAETAGAELGSYRRVMDFTHLVPGDTVTRLIGGQLPMPMRVVRVDATLIHCIQRATPVDVALANQLVWSFHRATGYEQDPSLFRGVEFGRTGSFLVPDTDPRCKRPARPRRKKRKRS